jgi:hypothetical protein
MRGKIQQNWSPNYLNEQSATTCAEALELLQHPSAFASGYGATSPLDSIS